MPLTEDRPDFAPQPSTGGGLVEDRPEQKRARLVELANLRDSMIDMAGSPGFKTRRGLSAGEQAEHAELAAWEAADHRATTERQAQVEAVLRGLMVPDPQLDAHRQMRTVYDAEGPRQENVGPRPVISSWSDPRFRQFQDALSKRLGRTAMADDVMGFLHSQGYDFDQAAMEGGRDYDPNALARFGQRLGTGATTLGGNLLSLAGALLPAEHGGQALTDQGADARRAADELRGIYKPGGYAQQVADAVAESAPGTAMGLGGGRLVGGAAKLAGAGTAAQTTAAIVGSGVTTGTANAPAVYEQGVLAGLSPGEAFASAAASVGIETATAGLAAKIPFLRQTGVEALLDAQTRAFAGQSLRGMLTKTGAGAAGDGLEEVVAQGLDSVRAKLAENPDLTLADALWQVGVAAGAGAATGGAVEAAVQVTGAPLERARLNDAVARGSDRAALAAMDPAGAQIVDTGRGQPELIEDRPAYQSLETTDSADSVEGTDEQDLGRAPDGIPGEPAAADPRSEPAPGHADVRGGTDHDGPGASEGVDDAEAGYAGVDGPAVAEFLRSGGDSDADTTAPGGDRAREDRAEAGVPQDDAGADESAGDRDGDGSDDGAGYSRPASGVAEPDQGAATEEAGPVADRRDRQPAFPRGRAKPDDAARADAADASGSQPSPGLIRASPNADKATQDAVGRYNREVSKLDPLPAKFQVRKAGGGFGPGNPKYVVPVRPDLTYQEFKKRIDPKDAALLGPGASADLKARFGWTPQHNQAAKYKDNYDRGQKRGDFGVRTGLRKTAGQFHRATTAGRKTANEYSDTADTDAAPTEAGPSDTAPARGEGAAEGGVVGEAAPAQQPAAEVPVRRRADGPVRTDEPRAEPLAKRGADADRVGSREAPRDDGAAAGPRARELTELEKFDQETRERRKQIQTGNVQSRRIGEGFRRAEERRALVQRQSGDPTAPVEGGMTEIELGKAKKRAASNYSGKPVITTYGRRGKVLTVAFGKVKVRFDDGSEVMVLPDKLEPADPTDRQAVGLPPLETAEPMTRAEFRDVLTDIGGDLTNERKNREQEFGEPDDRVRYRLSARPSRGQLTRADIDAAERVDLDSPAAREVLAISEALGIDTQFALLPSNVLGVFDPRTGSILINTELSESEIGEAFGHELTHRAVAALDLGEKRRLLERARDYFGDRELAVQSEIAAERWGDIGLDALVEELLSEGGADLVSRRGTGWLRADQGVWSKIVNWLRGAVDTVRALLGDSGAKSRRIAESVINQFAQATSTALQNGVNIAYDAEGDAADGLKFAIRDLAKTDRRFLASTQRKIEHLTVFMPQALAQTMTDYGTRIARTALTPAYVASQHAGFAPIFQAGRKKDERQQVLIDTVRRMTLTFMGLRGKPADRVNTTLEAQRLAKTHFTDAQLRQKGHDATEITAIKEVRAALDYLFDAREDAIWTAFAVPKQPPAQLLQTAKALRATDPVEAGRLQHLAELIQAQRDAKRDGYIPFQRVGQYRKITVEDAAGKVLHYTHVAGWWDLKSTLKVLKAKYPNDNIDVNRIVEKADQDTYSINESELRALAKNANVSQKLVDDLLAAGVDNYLVKEKFERFLIRSKDTPGYSTDFQSSLAQYALAASNSITSILFGADTKQAFNALANSDTTLNKYATEWKEYILGKGSDTPLIGSMAFIYHLGYNFGSAATNLTQLPLVTVPFLMGMSGSPSVVTAAVNGAFNATWSAIEEVAKNTGDLLTNQSPDHDMVEELAKQFAKTDPGLAAALRAARAAGVMTQLEVRDFTDRARTGGIGGSVASKAGRGLAKSAAFLFAKSERMVRLAAFVASYRTAEANKSNQKFWDRANKFGFHGKQGDAGAFAAFAVDETQGIYGKQNRPELFRGRVGSAIYTFRGFGMAMLTFLYKMAKLAASEPGWRKLVGAPAGALLSYLLMTHTLGGIWSALPGAQTLKGAVDTVWSLGGPKRSIEAEMERVLGHGQLAEWVNRGALGLVPEIAQEYAPGVAGMPGVEQALQAIGEYGPTIGRRAGLGNLIPASNELTAWLGPGVGAMVDYGAAGLQAFTGDEWAKAEAAATFAAGRTGSNVVKAVKAANSDRGIETMTGSTLIAEDDVGALDIAGLVLSMPTRKMTEAQRLNREVQRLETANQEVQKRFVSRVISADSAGDQAELATIITEIEAHNQRAEAEGRWSEIITKAGFQAALKNEAAERAMGVHSPRGVSKKAAAEAEPIMQRNRTRYETPAE